MAKARHARRRIGKGVKIALISACILGLSGGGVTYAGYRYDKDQLSRILPGVSISGVDVSGMTRDEAIAAVAQWARPRLFSPITISSAGHTWKETPSTLGMHAQVAAVVDRALAVSNDYDTLQRVWRRVRDEPVDAQLRLPFQPSTAPVDAFVNQVLQRVSIDPTDAAVEVVGGRVVLQHSKTGRTLAVKSSVERILNALRTGSTSVSLPTQPVAPKVTDETLGPTIVVRRDVHELSVYEGLRLSKTYPVATAALPYVTPPGQWTIVNKAENPTWINPAPDTWGAGMPLSIPPGEGNPLGTRALYLSAPGIRIHGTTEVSSIGTDASHGCIRMYMSDVEDLYPRIPIGTTVFIV